MSIDSILLDNSFDLRYDRNKESDNMIYPSIDKLLTKVGSKYLLVNLVSKRAKEMQETEYYQMKECEYISAKEIGKALEEVSKDLIHIED